MQKVLTILLNSIEVSMPAIDHNQTVYAMGQFPLHSTVAVAILKLYILLRRIQGLFST